MNEKKFEMLEPMKDPKDYLEIKDILVLFENAKNLRDKALIYTLFFTGKRVSEVLAIQTNDVFWEQNSIHFTILKKKTPRKSLKPVHKKVISVLHKYMTEERLIYHENAFVFYSKVKGWKYPMSRQRVDQILKEYGKKLRIKTKAGRLPHAHCFRHSFALWVASMLKTPADLLTLKKMMDHSSTELTAYYAERTVGEMKKFWENVELPF